MSKALDITTLEKEHEVIFPKSQALCNEIVRQLNHLIKKENIQLAVPIQYRAKTFHSIAEKISQGRFNIKKSLLELQDLAGVRIITLFKRDSIKVADLVISTFEVIKQYNTEERLEDSEFGYSSIHIVCQINKNWLDLPSFSDFDNMNFEIQIRTLSQHSWAEASNIFQYKRDESVPKPLKRSISRISALLETVDLEFERLLSERANYKIEAKETVNEKENNSTLNVDLLVEVLNNKLPEKHKSHEDNYSSLLENMIVLGYNTVEDLNTLIEKYLNKVLKENDRVCKGFSKLYEKNKNVTLFEHYGLSRDNVDKVLKGVFFTYSGLIRTMLTMDLGEEWHKLFQEKKKKLQPQ